MTYAQKTKDWITASKVKTFNKDPFLYELKYEKMIELDEADPRYFVTWDAFHYIMEHGKDAFLEKYYIDDWLVKAKQLDLILEHNKDRTEDQIKEAKKRLLPEVRAEYLKIVWADSKIELTPAEWRDLIGMYASALQQPMWDLWGEYIKEERFFAQYWDLKLSAKPDRIAVEDATGKRYSLESINEMLLGKQKNEQAIIISDLWLKSYIRDFKTSWDITWLKKELKYWDENKDYVLSMSFYYAIIYVLYGLESDVYLDVIETSDPYVTDTIWLSWFILKDCLQTKVKPILDRIIKCKKDWRFPPWTRDERLENKEMKKYIQYHPDYYQSTPSFLELDM